MPVRCPGPYRLASPFRLRGEWLRRRHLPQFVDLGVPRVCCTYRQTACPRWWGEAVPWCSGYHVCFTRRRSPVRSRAESRLFLPRVAWAASSRLATAATSACMAGSLCRPAALAPPSTPWRNGSASDSRSEGCVFKSRRGQGPLFVLLALAIARICVRSSIAEGVRERVERPPLPPAAVCPPPPR